LAHQARPELREASRLHDRKVRTGRGERDGSFGIGARHDLEPIADRRGKLARDPSGRGDEDLTGHRDRTTATRTPGANSPETQSRPIRNL
jgi:hypothetical protein